MFNAMFSGIAVNTFRPGRHPRHRYKPSRKTTTAVKGMNGGTTYKVDLIPVRLITGRGTAPKWKRW